MWSVGVILYIMVTGTAPFAGETVDELLEHIKEAKYEQIEPCLDVAQECRDVLAATLQVDYKDRPGCQQIKLMHFMKGPREKLVLAHCDFFISAPQKNSDQIIMDIRYREGESERERERERERREKERETHVWFVMDIRSGLEDNDTEVRDPKTTHHNNEQGDEQGEEEVEATVRTATNSQKSAP
jgi:calcium-dependent protein kinase